MSDKLKDLLSGRIPLPSGGPNAKIGPTPEPSSARKILEIFTGYPADPERDMTAVDAIQMMLVGGGIGKGLQKGFRSLKSLPSADPLEIIKDPYGQAPTMGRRGFFDRASGKPVKRISKRLNTLSDQAWQNGELDTRVGHENNLFDSVSNPHGWRKMDGSSDGWRRTFTPTETAMYKEFDDLELLQDARQGIGDSFSDDGVPGPVGSILQELIKRAVKLPGK